MKYLSVCSLHAMLLFLLVIPCCGKSDIYMLYPGEKSPSSTDPVDTETETESDSTETIQSPGFFHAVWGSHPDNIWVAGPCEPPLIHWNGSNWQEIAFEEAAPNIFDLSGTGPGHVNAVGDCPIVPEPDNGLDDSYSACILSHTISSEPEQWDQVLQLPSQGTNFISTWSVSLVDTYAVGTQRIFRHNGTTWSPIALPSPFTSWPGFTAVNGTAGNNIIVAGIRGECAENPSEMCGGLIRWDGDIWLLMNNTGIDWPNFAVPNAIDFGDSTLFVVTNKGWFYSIDSTVVSEEQVHTESLEAVWTNGSDEVWVAGRSGFVARLKEGTWTEAHLSEDLSFFDIWGHKQGGDSPTQIWLVGGTETGETEWSPIVLHFDGVAWAQSYPY